MTICSYFTKEKLTLRAFRNLLGLRVRPVQARTYVLFLLNPGRISVVVCSQLHEAVEHLKHNSSRLQCSIKIQAGFQKTI